MSNKFNGRIQQKHATAAEWSLATNFKPLEGELIVYEATSEQPYPRFKVGDGINFVNDLPFSDKEVWAALANKQPLGDYATKDYVDSGDEIPFFDLVTWGMPNVAVGKNEQISLNAEKVALVTSAGERGIANVRVTTNAMTCVLTMSAMKNETNNYYVFSSFDPAFPVTLGLFDTTLVCFVFEMAQKSDITSAISAITPDSIGAQPAGNYLTQHQSLAGYAKTSDITSHNTSTSAHSDIRSAIPTKVSQLTNDSGYLTQHQSLADYAKTSDLTAHNTNTAAHNDMRLLITGLTNRLNALANSDDTTLDDLAEVVAYIKNNKSLIDGITTSKVNVSDIINNLTTNVSNKPLSAAQGVALKALIDAKAAKSDLTGLATETYVQNMIETSIVGGEW